MKIRRIGCKYFLGFGEWQEIYFEDQHNIVSIVAEWSDEPKRSNRSGKSSFVDILRYNFFGKARAKKEVDLINQNFEEDMLTEVEFGNGVIIQRGRTIKGEMLLNFSGYEGADKKVVQEEINKLLGMTYEDFEMITFFMQGDIHTFMEAGTTGQKQIIARWVEKDYWKTYEKRTKDKIDKLKDDINSLSYIASNNPDPSVDRSIKDNINILEKRKNGLESELETLKNKLEEVNNQINKADEKNDLERQIKRIKRDIDNLIDDKSNIFEEIAELQNELEEANKRLEKTNKIEEFKAALTTAQEDMQSFKDKYNEANDILSNKKAELNQLRKQYEQIKKFDNICPVMKKQCTAIESINSENSNILKKGRIIASKLLKFEENVEVCKSVYEKSIDNYNIAKSALKEVQGLLKLPWPDQIKTKISNSNSKLSEKEDQLNQKNDDLKQANSKLRKIENIDIDELKTQKDEIKSEIVDNDLKLRDIINNIAKLRAELKINEQNRIKSIQAQKKINELTEALNLHKLVAFMFGKNGIPSNQIETAFSEIENETNLILEKLQSNMSIEFSPDREIDKWEENCLVCGSLFPKNYRKTQCPDCDNERQKKRKDDLIIKIKSGDKEIDFNLESGGGKVLISIAIRLAFARMLRRRAGARLNLIVFDEVFGMLDSVNRQSVFRLLTNSLYEEFGFDLVLAISHEEEIRDVIPHVIKITKFQDYSIFEWG